MYDKKAELLKIQKDLLSKVKTACHTNGIPFLFIAPATDDGKSTEWICDGIPAGEIEGMKLSDDRIRKALAVLNGFEDELFENKKKEPEMVFEIGEEELVSDGIDDDEFNAGLIDDPT